MPNPTTNFAWVVPTVGGSTDAWGSILNAVFDSIDSALHDINNTFNAASTKKAQWTNTSNGVGAGFALNGAADVCAYSFAALGSAFGGTTYAGITGNSQVVWEAQSCSSLVIGATAAAPIIFAQNRVEKMRLDTAGKLGIGNTAPTYQLDIQKVSAGENATTTVNLANTNAGASAGTAYRQYNGSHTYAVAFTGASYTPTTTYDFGDAVYHVSDGAGGLNFAAINGPVRFFCAAGANPAETMRLDPTVGTLLIGTTTYDTNRKLIVATGIAASNPAEIYTTNASPGATSLLSKSFTAAAPNNTTASFMSCNDNAATRLVTYANGGLANYSANNVNLSDARAKNEFIAYDDVALKSLEASFIRVDWGRFKYNDQSHTDWNHGYTAQGVARAFAVTAPELVEDVDLGPTDANFKGVYETDLNNISHALLARALKRIEQLETQVARLTHG